MRRVGHDADDLVDQRRPGGEPPMTTCHPGATDAGVDQELGELAITWVSHGRQYKTYVRFVKFNRCRS